MVDCVQAPIIPRPWTSHVKMTGSIVLLVRDDCFNVFVAILKCRPQIIIIHNLCMHILNDLVELFMS
jgi:hypothetical protein